MKVISKQSNSRMCFVCGLDNNIGLKAEFYNMEDGSVMCPFQFSEKHQSVPGRAHGGLIATMLDELGARSLWTQSKEKFCVTMSIEVKYRKPVPYDQNLIGKAKIERETQTFATVNAQIFDEFGTLLAGALIKYIKLSIDKINKNVDAHEELCYKTNCMLQEIDFKQK